MNELAIRIGGVLCDATAAVGLLSTARCYDHTLLHGAGWSGMVLLVTLAVGTWNFRSR